jgi:hypothetical protein
MAWSELEQQTDRALKALPEPHAPSSLVPNVMRAVAAASEARTPWYSRAWLTWPLEAQLASLALVAIVGAAFWREGPIAWTWASSAFSTVRTPAWVSTSLDLANRALSIGRLPWHFFQNVLLYFALLALVASIATIASWHAFTRLISEGASVR